MALAAKIAVGALAAYAALCLALAALQGSLLFHPWSPPGSPADHGLPDFREVTFSAADGVVLTGWLHENPARDKAAIYFYGNADSLAGSSTLLRNLADGGFSVLGVNYRGYGGSAGAPSEEGLYRDADAALAFLGQFVPRERVVVIGRSLGSGVAVDLASRTPVKAVVLISPYTSIPDAGADVYWFLPVRLLARYAFASLDKIGRIGAPLLVIHGERDAIIPVEHGVALHRAAREPKRLSIFAGQGHNSLDLRRIAAETIGFVGGL
jgi:fermentation-respiration switch protein FrsA (DUF1100 family)